MTRTKKAKGTVNEEKQGAHSHGTGTEIRWINPAPNSGDVEWLENNPDHSVEDAIVMFDGLHTGQRLTCKYDERTGRWIAVLFDNIPSEDGKIPALSVRGASALDALLLCAYYVVRKYPEGWQKTGSTPTSRFG